jgi:hypothetical protein
VSRAESYGFAFSNATLEKPPFRRNKRENGELSLSRETGWWATASLRRRFITPCLTHRRYLNISETVSPFHRNDFDMRRAAVV